MALIMTLTIVFGSLLNIETVSAETFYCEYSSEGGCYGLDIQMSTVGSSYVWTIKNTSDEQINFGVGLLRVTKQNFHVL